MNTLLYQGFGGWEIQKDEEMYYQAGYDTDWDKCKTLAKIEIEAAKDPDHLWEAILNLPLRGGTWTRNRYGHWVLTESNQGFA